MRSPALKTAVATVAFATVHSLLASRAAKGLAERAVGTRLRNALYRPAYNAVAVATTAALVGYVARQPARVVYHVRGPAAGLMRAGQVAAGAMFARAAFEVGLMRLSGLANLVAWARGGREVPREPEAQTAPPDEVAGLGAGSPFAMSRHPLNFFPVPLLWLNPRMTTKLAAFGAAATVYFYVGSVHSDRRLRGQYGGKFEGFRGRVPLFVPELSTFSRKNRGIGVFRGRELLENKGKDR
jgi:protein-S-isoprenylcysteine O-methyltransferase Ste14